MRLFRSVLLLLLGTPIFASCVAVTGVPADMPSSLGVILDQEMRVVFVETGGAADAGGVKTGDILKKLDDRELTTPNQARNVFHRADALKPITLVLLCDDIEITIRVQPAPIEGVPGVKTPTPVPADHTYF